MTGPGVCDCRTCARCPAVQEQGQLLRAWPEATPRLAGLSVGAMSPQGCAPHRAARVGGGQVDPSPGACGRGGWSRLEAGAPEGVAAVALSLPKAASALLLGPAGPSAGAVARGQALCPHLAAWDGECRSRAVSVAQDHEGAVQLTAGHVVVRAGQDWSLVLRLGSASRLTCGVAGLRSWSHGLPRLRGDLTTWQLEI